MPIVSGRSRPLLGPSGVHGTSRGLYVVDEAGSVRCRLLEAPEGSESVALAAMESVRYEPDRDALGRPVVVWLSFTLTAEKKN
jgi:hypothetical protein